MLSELRSQVDGKIPSAIFIVRLQLTNESPGMIQEWLRAFVCLRPSVTECTSDHAITKVIFDDEDAIPYNCSCINVCFLGMRARAPFLISLMSERTR